MTIEKKAKDVKILKLMQDAIKLITEKEDRDGRYVTFECLSRVEHVA
jgi:hypothetical protein